MQELPRVWDRVEARWPEEFTRTPIQVQAEVELRQLGAEIRPIRPK